jgi:diguanylate cyclase (GGDEF)-like protein
MASEDFKTILVLDDDPQFHKLVVPVLTRRGHRVLSAHLGAEARILIDQEKIDLAIVDGQLPDITGIEWTANVREAGHKMLIMFVSAYWRDAQSYHKLTKELGVSLVLHKPIIASVFAAEVDILLGKTASYGEPAQRDFEDTLLALRAEYARELPERMLELSDLIAQMQAQPENRFLPGEARTRAHKLRGTAASYGFKELGDLVAAIEDQLVRLIKGDGQGDGRLAKINAALAKANHIASQAAREAESKEFRAADPHPLPRPDVYDGAPMARILVVDDDAAFLDLIDELARRHQLETVRAHNAYEALELGCMNQVDAALIDVDLGSRDVAFKLASDLRLIPGYGDLPLGFLSGAGHIEKSVAVENVGHCILIDRLTKADALEAALRQLMAIKQVSRPRVLLLDDDVEFLKRTAFVLAHEGMEVRTLQTTVDILEEMQQFSPDLLLLDVMMPGVSGFDVCRMLRTIPRWRDLPIVFLTAYTDVDTRVACLKCGGDDYLLKPVVNEELLVRLSMRLERSRSLKLRVEYDNLTGLLLRRPFMEQFSGMISEARRNHWQVSLGLVDIRVARNRLQEVVSDSVLAAAGNLLQKKCRTEDLKGRATNSQLLVAIRNEPKSSMEAIMMSIASDFATNSAVGDGESARPQLFYGLACYPDDGGSIHELLIEADRRLHQTIKSAAGEPVS